VNILIERSLIVVLVNLDLVDTVGCCASYVDSRSVAFSALFAAVLASFRNRAALQLELFALRHQLGVLRRSEDSCEGDDDGFRAFFPPYLVKAIKAGTRGDAGTAACDRDTG
jgi:hypothetical protein